jgi:hypothetical protein
VYFVQFECFNIPASERRKLSMARAFSRAPLRHTEKQAVNLCCYQETMNSEGNAFQTADKKLCSTVLVFTFSFWMRYAKIKVIHVK